MTTTRNRVPDHTAREINDRIQRQIDESILYYDRHRDQIPQRLRELSEEWDVERAIEANASVLAFAGVAIGSTGRSRLWLLLPALVTSFLFQHAVQGWCPPVPILRRLGFRTSYEIEQERLALKVVRGDFDGIAGAENKPEAALKIVRG